MRTSYDWLSIRLLQGRPFAAAVALIFAATVAPTILAQTTLYWDGTGTGAVGGGSGTWDTTLTRWSPAASGSTYQGWNNTSNDDAVFGGVAGTVTLGTDITARSLTFDATGYSLTGSGTLTLAGGYGDINTGTGDQSVATVIAGSTGLTKYGSGALTLSGANTYTGATTIRSGTFVINPTGSMATGDYVSVGYSTGDSGFMQISSGGSVSNTYGYIANSGGSSGTVDVAGTWTNSSVIAVGHTGTGTLTIQTGALVSDVSGVIGWYAGSSGTADVAGTWTNSNDIDVGSYSSGTLTIQSSGSVTNVVGYVGSNTSGSGTVDVAGTWSNSSDLHVGESGTGVLTIQSGGSVSNSVGYIGYNNGSSGTVDVTGTWTNSSTLYVGKSGTGVLTIRNGGFVTNAAGYIGNKAGNSGTVDVSGTWTNSDRLIVGQYGTGALTIRSGGSVSNTDGYIGYSGASGTADISGTWTNSGSLMVGYNTDGTGTLTIQSGGSVSNTYGYLGFISGSSGTADVTGTWSNVSNLYVGYSGTGALTIKDGGSVNVTGATGKLTLANDIGSSGTLNLGAGGAVGTLNTVSVNGGGGAATLNFNHSGAGYYFTTDGTDTGSVIAITGSTAVNQVGTGTTVFTGANTYTGPTMISGGTLIIEGAQSGTGLVTVGANGGLGGGGSIAGNLHFDAGASWLFDPASTFTVNGATVTFDGFGVGDIVGLSSATTLGTYSLIDGSSTVDMTNVTNVGLGNIYDLGSNVGAYLQVGSLQLVVTQLAAVPEPVTSALLVGLAIFGLALRRRRIRHIRY